MAKFKVLKDAINLKPIKSIVKTKLWKRKLKISTTFEKRLKTKGMNYRF